MKATCAILGKELDKCNFTFAVAGSGSFLKVITMCANIKLSDIMTCFHFIAYCVSLELSNTVSDLWTKHIKQNLAHASVVDILYEK